jgi:serine/threonine-protein kinase
MSSRAISHYLIAEQIGGGGNGSVWRADDTLLGRPVALKFLSDTSASDPSSRERFFREARAASALNHPNIVTIYEINPEGAQPFIAMELVRGRALSKVLREYKRLPATLTVDYVAQICDGLGAAHRAGIVHRDIKPSNVMLTPEGAIKILDFGLAKAAPRDAGAATLARATTITGSADEPLSQAGVVMGTVPYMSPEQAAGDPVDSRSDVFSVGIILYELLSGQRPFQGSSNTEIMKALLTAEPAPLSTVADDVPEPLVRIVHKCLRKSPDERYRDGAEIAAQLRALDRSGWPPPASDLTTVTIAATSTTRSRVRVRPRRLAIAGAILVLAAALAGGYKWWQSSKGSNPSRAADAALAQTEALERAQAYLLRYDRKDNINSAIALLEANLRSNSGSAAVYATLAEAYARKYTESKDQQWLPKAMESGRQAVRINYDLAAAHTALGMALAANAMEAEAAAEFDRAISLNPLSGPAYSGLAKLRSGKEAEDLYQKAIASSPGSWIPVNELAAFYYTDARYGESIETWRKALALAEDNVRVMVNLGAGLHKIGRYAEAADSIQQALRLDESNPMTWANLGTARYFQGRYLDAARATEKAVERAPGRYLYWGNLADNYRWAEGKKQLAAESYRKAIGLVRQDLKLKPDSAGLHSALAAYLAKSGDTRAALAELSRLGGIKESDPLFKAAMVYELAGDRDQALAALKRAVQAGYSMHEVANEPELAALRADPGYAGIVRLRTESKKE